MTVLLEAPVKSRPAVTHVIDAGHFDTRGERIALQFGIQLPVRYLVALLYSQVMGYREDIDTPEKCREMVGMLIFHVSFRDMEDAAEHLEANEPSLDADDMAWLAFCRVAVAEAFGLDPWAA